MNNRQINVDMPKKAKNVFLANDSRKVS
jgi:hypothetical protein